MLKLSEAIALGTCLERGGSPLGFKACAIGLGMAAMGVPEEERTAKKAEEMWPWLRQVHRESFFGLIRVDYMREIGDWYFNVRLGRITMATLVGRVRDVEPAEIEETTRTINYAGGQLIAE